MTDLLKKATPCEHPELKPELSATTSLMHVAFSMFGFKCLKCGKVWDIGNLAEALQQHERLLQVERAAKETNERLVAVIVDYVCGGKPPVGEPLRTWHDDALRRLEGG